MAPKNTATNATACTELSPYGASFSFTADANAANMRVDQFISQQFPLYSRNFFQQLIQHGQVTINNTTIYKSGTHIKLNDSITLKFPDQTPKPLILTQTDFNIAVVYEHEHFLIINKPAGLAVHAPSHHSTQPTVVDWILANRQEITSIGAADRPGIVHRLDKNTSGLLIISRTHYAHTAFDTLFKERQIKKTYLAFVQGHPDKAGSINLLIGRDPFNKIKMVAIEPNDYRAHKINKLRDAQSDYTVIHYFADYSLVEIQPKTGRTHQIRAHFEAIGHPLTGDIVYGGTHKYIERHALHAQKLAFMFDGHTYSFDCPIPQDMQKLSENPIIEPLDTF